MEILTYVLEGGLAQGLHGQWIDDSPR